jgi:hypothetical protein
MNARMSARAFELSIAGRADNVAGRNVLLGIARYCLFAYGYYGGGRVSTLRFLYKVRYAVGLYDCASEKLN